MYKYFSVNLRRTSNKQASKQTNKQTSKQINKQTSKQTNKQISKQTSKQTISGENDHRNPGLKAGRRPEGFR